MLIGYNRPIAAPTDREIGEPIARLRAAYDVFIGADPEAVAQWNSYGPQRRAEVALGDGWRWYQTDIDDQSNGSDYTSVFESLVTAGLMVRVTEQVTYRHRRYAGKDYVDGPFIHLSEVTAKLVDVSGRKSILCK
jgi:hypothetical protein